MPKIDEQRIAASYQSSCQTAEVLSREVGTWSGYTGFFDEADMACAATTNRGLPEEWLTDTGASCLLADKGNITGERQKSLKKFNSANGIVKPLGQLSKEVLPGISETIQVMENSPNLMPHKTLAKHGSVLVAT